MEKPKSNYKGMGNGPIGKKLAHAKMPKPTILHAGGGRVASKAPPAYHPPRSGGSHTPSIQGILSHQQAEEKGAITATIKAAKAGQGLSVAEQQLQLVEDAMKRMGISLDDEQPMNEGGM